MTNDCFPNVHFFNQTNFGPDYQPDFDIRPNGYEMKYKKSIRLCILVHKILLRFGS